MENDGNILIFRSGRDELLNELLLTHIDSNCSIIILNQKLSRANISENFQVEFRKICNSDFFSLKKINLKELLLLRKIKFRKIFVIWNNNSGFGYWDVMTLLLLLRAKYYYIFNGNQQLIKYSKVNLIKYFVDYYRNTFRIIIEWIMCIAYVTVRKVFWNKKNG